jgi:hypothetical protein
MKMSNKITESTREEFAIKLGERLQYDYIYSTHYKDRGQCNDKFY